MEKQIVLSKNNLFFYFLLFGYIFGVLLYNSSDTFKYVDEIMALFLVLFTGIIVWERKKNNGFISIIDPWRYLHLLHNLFICY